MRPELWCAAILNAVVLSSPGDTLRADGDTAVLKTTDADCPRLVWVSPHLYETDILLLRELGHEADAVALMRRQFRIA